MSQSAAQYWVQPWGEIKKKLSQPEKTFTHNSNMRIFLDFKWENYNTSAGYKVVYTCLKAKKKH